MSTSKTTPPVNEPEEGGEEEEEAWLIEARKYLTQADWEEFELSDEAYDAMEPEDVEAHNERLRARSAARKAESEEEEARAEAEEEEEGGDEEDDEEEEGEGGEEGGDEQEDRVEKFAEPVVAAAEVGGAEPADEELQPEDVAEGNFVYYLGSYWGIPDEYIVHRAKDAMEFETADEMNAMLGTKSGDPWRHRVFLKHINVVHSNDRATPKGWYAGKDDRKLEDFEFDTFYYVTAYVKPTPGDAESERKAAHDKLVFRMVHKQPAYKLWQKFTSEKVQQTLTPERRAQYAAVLNWSTRGAEKGPQVDPKQERWPKYDRLKLATAYIRPDSTPRPKGQNHKQVKAGLAVPTTKGGKRSATAPAGKAEGKKPKVIQDDDDDDDDDDNDNDDEEEEEDAGAGSEATIEWHRVAARAEHGCQVRPPKMVRYIKLINPAKAHWFVVPDQGPRGDQHFLAIEEWE